MTIKKIRLILLFLLLIAFSPLFSQTTSSTKVVKQETKEKIVYVTKTGTKYHQSSCGYLSKSSIKKEMKDAKKEGYTACSRCKGGVATTTKSKATTSSQCTATTKAGSRCKRKSASGSSKCWQH